MNDHPCKTRCWRVGVPTPCRGGVCEECGRPRIIIERVGDAVKLYVYGYVIGGSAMIPRRHIREVAFGLLACDGDGTCPNCLQVQLAGAYRPHECMWCGHYLGGSDDE